MSTILVVCTLASGLQLACREKPIATGSVQSTLDSLEQKLNWLTYRIGVEEWNKCQSGRSDSLEFFYKLRYHTLLDQQTRSLLIQGRGLLETELDQRRCDILLSQIMPGSIESHTRVVHLRDSLLDLFDSDGNCFDEEIDHLIPLGVAWSDCKTSECRESRFRQWAAKGDQLAEGIARLVRLRNHYSSQLGYSNYMNLYFKYAGLPTDDYSGLLDQIDSITAAPYQQVIKSVRALSGGGAVDLWDLNLTWEGAVRRVDRYFPADSQLIFARRTLTSSGFDLDKLPIYFDVDRNKDSQPFVKAQVIRSPHDIRIALNPGDGIWFAERLMHEMGNALHMAYLIQDRELFGLTVDDAWQEGMSTLISSICSDQDWLVSQAHLPVDLAQQYSLARSTASVVELRWLVMLLKFEMACYQNPPHDFNRLYWDTFEEIMFLPRHDDLIPWAAISSFVRRPAKFQRYLFGNMIAAQSLDYLAGTFGTGNSAQVQAFLVQNYFRFGSRYEWGDLIERGTGQKLSPLFLLSNTDN